MKKFLALLLALIMILSLAACSKDEDKKVVEEEDGVFETDMDKYDENSGEKLVAEYRELCEQYVEVYKEDPYSSELSQIDQKINAKASEISDYKTYLILEYEDEADDEIEAIEEEIQEIAEERMSALYGD